MHACNFSVAQQLWMQEKIEWNVCVIVLGRDTKKKVYKNIKMLWKECSKIISKCHKFFGSMQTAASRLYLMQCIVLGVQVCLMRTIFFLPCLFNFKADGRYHVSRVYWKSWNQVFSEFQIFKAISEVYLTLLGSKTHTRLVLEWNGQVWRWSRILNTVNPVFTTI